MSEQCKGRVRLEHVTYVCILDERHAGLHTALMHALAYREGEYERTATMGPVAITWADEALFEPKESE